MLDFQADLQTKVQEKLDVVAKFQSKRLSIDHTFRVVKNVIAIVPAGSRYLELLFDPTNI